MTLDNVLSYESSQKKLAMIFKKYEELVGKKTMYSIIEDEEEEKEIKKGHLFDNVNKIN
jgi:hypothetical protein